MLAIYFSVISIIIATIIGVTSIWWANRIVKKSGGYKKVSLDILVFGHSLIQEQEFSEVIFGYSADKPGKILCFLNFIVANNGEISGKNVHVRFCFPKALRGGEGFGDEISKSIAIHGIYDKSELKRKSHIRNGFECVDYLIPELSPKTGALIQEPIDIVNASGAQYDIETKLKDGVKKTLRVNLGWISKIEAEVSATDIEFIKGFFQVRSYEANTKEDLSRKIMEEETKFVREELKKINAPENFVSKIYAPGLRNNTIVIFPKLERIKNQKNKNKSKDVYIENNKESKRWLIKAFDDSTNKKGKNKFRLKLPFRH